MARYHSVLNGQTSVRRVQSYAGSNENVSMNWDHIKFALCRWGYLASMYSGIRAVFNRIRSTMCTDGPQLARLHGTRLGSQEVGDLVLFVHSRPKPQSFSGEAHFGMISIQQMRPNLGPYLHRYFCGTSHFGCGQMEIAFYEKRGKVTLYALRNTASSNAFRLGWHDVSRKLMLSGRDDVVMLVVMQYLEKRGFATGLADVSECLRLSISSWLLSPASRLQAMYTMNRKYSQLHKTLRTHTA